MTEGSSATAETPSAERLAELLKYPPRDYNKQHSVAAIGSGVDVVATGVLANPRSGRAVYGSPDDPHPTFRTITFDLEAVEVLGGNEPDLLPRDNVVVEMRAPNPMMGDDGLEEVKTALPPEQRGLFFLNVYDIANTTTVKGEDPNLVYLAPHPQGVALETAIGRTVTPTDPIPGVDSSLFEPLVSAARTELAITKPAHPGG